MMRTPALRIRRARFRAIAIAALFLLLCDAGRASRPDTTFRAEVLEDSVYAPALHRHLLYRAVVPRSPGLTQHRAALFLLHGFGGDHRSWTSSVDLTSIVDSTGLVVITPNGENSWYVNSATDSLDRFEDAIVTTLLPAVTGKFHIDSARVGVAGFSMGGFGALSLGLRHPAQFVFIGAFSASLDVPLGIPDLERNNRGGLRQSLEQAFGTDPSEWPAGDPRTYLHGRDSASVPYLYLATGIRDEFTGRLSLYRDFADILRENRFAYEYHETPGRHNWAYCRQEIGPCVRTFLRIIESAKPVDNP
jgi:putative tributyrin esterase